MRNGREANLTKQVEILKNKVLFVYLLCFVHYFLFRVEASSNAVKRDISITKGMELAQLPAKYVYYLLIT